ncbi:MAG: hypothetical protein BWY11_00335 [Firmicutes bacterium ADurb.Bin182]|nr:MAG: hypothetical protein BWY11_00335 [Firmicutes bacterium ADurb.Bin182]
MIIVVPRGRTVFAKTAGVTIDDSICTCESMKPGQRYAPFASTSVVASYEPTPIIVSPNIATSRSMISRVNTLTVFEFLITSVATPSAAAVINVCRRDFFKCAPPLETVFLFRLVRTFVFLTLYHPL